MTARMFTEVTGVALTLLNTSWGGLVHRRHDRPAPPGPRDGDRPSSLPGRSAPGSLHGGDVRRSQLPGASAPTVSPMGAGREAARRFVMDAGHRPPHGAALNDSPHLAFYEVLGIVSLTWGEVLESAGRPDLEIGNFAVVNVVSDFHHEMFVGQLTIDVEVERIGTSSLTLKASVVQTGRETGQVRATLVQINTDRTASAPLTDEQRAALQLV